MSPNIIIIHRIKHRLMDNGLDWVQINVQAIIGGSSNWSLLTDQA